MASKKIFGVKTVILPNGISIEKKYLKRRTLEKYIFFPGSLEFLENRKDFTKLLNNEFNIVKKIIPEIKIYQTGGDNRKYFTNNINVNELGTLNRKNYLNYLQRALLVIVPSSAGPGTKIKVIEALCYNKSLLTTKHGTKGIEKNFNKKIVYSNISEFKNKIKFLKKNNFKIANNKKMGDFFRKHYNIKNIIRKFYERHL